MAQNDLVIANQSFPSFRSDLNSALQAIQTTHSGTSLPTGALAGQIWLDTTNATSPTLKFYDGTDSISLATINYTANTVDWLDSSVTITGLSTTATGTVLTLTDTAHTTSVNMILGNNTALRFNELTANGSNYIGLKAPASVTADLTFTLPVAPTVNNQALISTTAGVMAFTPYTFPTSDGTASQVLQTNGSGVLSFATAGFFADGSSASPSITFTSDTNTGIFRSASDEISFTTGGTSTIKVDQYQRLMIDHSGDHKCIQTANTNATFSNQSIATFNTRSASSAYSFYVAVANNDQKFNLRGDGNAFADGTWSNNGADYAEFFESLTGESIAVGSTVVLENNKVRLANSSDSLLNIIGVVRPKEAGKASMMVGNTAWNKWSNTYLTDDFDRYIMEDHQVIEWEENIENDVNITIKKHSYESWNVPNNIVIPENAIYKTHDEKGNKFQHYKLNPLFNPNAEYVNRENRDEWLIIGLVGQVKILKNQQVNERWIKMRNVSENVEEWFIR